MNERIVDAGLAGLVSASVVYGLYRNVPDLPVAVGAALNGAAYIVCRTGNVKDTLGHMVYAISLLASNYVCDMFYRSMQ